MKLDNSYHDKAHYEIANSFVIIFRRYAISFHYHPGNQFHLCTSRPSPVYVSISFSICCHSFIRISVAHPLILLFISGRTFPCLYVNIEWLKHFFSKS